MQDSGKVCNIAVAGHRGTGKTSLLEAIVLLAWGRSHRTTTDAEIVRWGGEYTTGV